jgi:hypothetical protein
MEEVGASMVNRRQYYRHNFDPHASLSVLLRTTDGSISFFSELVNLSIGGMCVGAERHVFTPTISWTATFNLPPQTGTLNIPIEPVHFNDGPCGFRFLPRAKPTEQEDQDRAIWSFLLNEQCGTRRKSRAQAAG